MYYFALVRYRVIFNVRFHYSSVLYIIFRLFRQNEFALLPHESILTGANVFADRILKGGADLDTSRLVVSFR